MQELLRSFIRLGLEVMKVTENGALPLVLKQGEREREIFLL